MQCIGRRPFYIFSYGTELDTLDIPALGDAYD